MRIPAVTLAISTIALTGSAQTSAQDKSLTFEVASIKPAQPPQPDAQGRILLRGPSGGPGSKDPGRVNYPYMTLKYLLTTAYNVKNFQITGPSWLDTERFDITATMPPETTKEQFQIMLQNLLIDRFRMSIHPEKKELPMYSMVVVKAGKLKESTTTGAPVDLDNPPPPPPPGPPKIGADGFPIMPAAIANRPGIFMMMMPGRARWTANAQTMQELANRLSNEFSRPVIDNTGLTAKYDFTLTFAPDPNQGAGRGAPFPLPGPGAVAIGRGPGPGPGAGPGPGGNDNVFVPDGETPPLLLGALQSQLGLKLEPKKGPVDIIVIDKIEKNPTEN
jgi:uncharacterized protein (TIGR03435 family)